MIFLLSKRSTCFIDCTTISSPSTLKELQLKLSTSSWQGCVAMSRGLCLWISSGWLRWRDCCTILLLYRGPLWGYMAYSIVCSPVIHCIIVLLYIVLLYIVLLYYCIIHSIKQIKFLSITWNSIYCWPVPTLPNILNLGPSAWRHQLIQP